MGLLQINGWHHCRERHPGSAGKPVFFNSVFNDVIIDSCTVEYNYRWTCISISSGKLDGRPGNANYIRNCTAAYSCADGIRMNGVSDSFIEYWVLYKNGAWPNPRGRNLGGLGAWFFDAVNCTIQYCEASWVGAAETDGGAFDIDYWQKNSTVQYCYGHHCAGYGVSVFGADPAYPTENSLVRYNIFAHNGRDRTFAVNGDFFLFTWNGGLLNGVNIHDNYSYWDPVVPAPSLRCDADFTGNHPNLFVGNTVHSAQPRLVTNRSDSLKCDSNRYLTDVTPPRWDSKKGSFDALADWQRATGFDNNSSYEEATRDQRLGMARSPKRSKDRGASNKTVPKWYKSDRRGIRLRESTAEVYLNEADPVPDFRAKTVQGKNIALKDFSGTPFIVSFTVAHSSLQTEDHGAINAQLAYLKSMVRQYGDQGLKIIMIDESGVLKNSPDIRMSVNFTEDHASEAMLWLHDDPTGKLAKAFSVTQAPETFLISRDRTIARRWTGMALPAEIAFVVENELKHN
jgi:peroxiredoxin